LPEGDTYDNEEDAPLSKDEEVLQMLEENFEKGLLALKELVKEEQTGAISLPFEKKHNIISKLLEITTIGYQNPAEQYKQAYSLKALMWLKEEFIGLEECFKLTHLVLDIFANAMIDGRDSSI
jgi:hypothetical protein